jgi:hypothetical protein
MQVRTIFLLSVFAFALSFGQSNSFPLKHEDFSVLLMNYETPFHGTISEDEKVIKLKIDKAVKNPEKQEQYFVSGYSDVDGTVTPFSGDITFTQRYNVKDLPDEMLVFGDFVMKEPKSESGTHSGIFSGKVRIQTMKNMTKESKGGVTFKGKWKNYSGNLDFEAWWANFVPTDISKVIFK